MENCNDDHGDLFELPSVGPKTNREPNILAWRNQKCLISIIFPDFQIWDGFDMKRTPNLKDNLYLICSRLLSLFTHIERIIFSYEATTRYFRISYFLTLPDVNVL